MYTPRWLKVGAAAVVGIAAAVSLEAFTRPPQLVSVAVLKASVATMQAVPTADIQWTQVASPPPNAITPGESFAGLVASQTLAPGTILTSGDFTSPQANNLHPGEVQWLVPVSAAASGLPAVGQRVDVWSTVNNQYQMIAMGVRVVGLYTTQGGPISAPSATNPNTSGPGMVAMAVPSTALGTLLNVTSPYLVVDPNQPGFELVSSSASSSKAANTSIPVSPNVKPPKTSKSASLPSTHGG